MNLWNITHLNLARVLLFEPDPTSLEEPTYIPGPSCLGVQWTVLHCLKISIGHPLDGPGVYSWRINYPKTWYFPIKKEINIGSRPRCMYTYRTYYLYTYIIYHIITQLLIIYPVQYIWPICRHLQVQIRVDESGCLRRYIFNPMEWRGHGEMKRRSQGWPRDPEDFHVPFVGRTNGRFLHVFYF